MKLKFFKYIASSFGILSLAFSAVASAPAGYYNSLDGKSGTALWNAVKAIGKKNFHAISYGTSTWEAFQSTDVRVVNGEKCWWDIYSNNNVPATTKPSSMNIEHSVANSWWGGTKNDAYKDIVHLNPSNADANSRKSNYPLGKIGNVTWDNGVTFIGKPASGYGGGNNYVYEPHDDYKGDFARVFMYMFVIYDDISWKSNTDWIYDTSSDIIFKPWAYNMLLEWSAKDPVSAKETARNDGVALEQGNRNPFIDLPDLADYIWGSKRGEAYHLDGDHDPVIPDDPKDPDDPENPVNPDDPKDPVHEAGTYVLVKSNSDFQTGHQYVIVGDYDNEEAILSTENAGKYFKHTSGASYDGESITAIPADAAIVTPEATGSKYYLHVSDIKGNSQGYIHAAGSKNVTYTDTPSTAATISIANGTASVDYGSVGKLQYNASAPRFTTYTSGQKDLRFYRYIPPISTVVDEELRYDDDSFLVEVWGNNILAPEGAVIYDLNGRVYSGENLECGVYIVTKSTFRRAVKVMVK